jgi:hypothetical protein
VSCAGSFLCCLVGMSLSLLKDVADYLTPVLHSSQFSLSGVLTPDEFTSSGDQLVHACRTWKWEGGSKATNKSYLDPHKQYLITRNVPCMCRANAYARQVSHSIILPCHVIACSHPPPSPLPAALSLMPRILFVVGRALTRRW